MFKRTIRNIITVAISIFLLSHAASIMADDVKSDGSAILSTSKQLIIIISDDWKSDKGQLKHFERNDTQSNWQSLGEIVSVSLGEAGMGWSTSDPEPDLVGPKKHEGDKRTPAGLFSISQAFGFAHVSPVNTKLIYTPITPNTVCIDDQNSRFYNKIVDADKILQPDWKSAEKMHDINIYEQGIIVRYNNRKPVPGAGSCIFMHNWRSPTGATNGCVALSPSDLKELITWLDSNKRPVLIMLPKGEYQLLAKSWNLPELG
jgi:L,D-peptidoglycan transpeptidase YkuD (ErfK/YbiS/YcfS/YnhG family)